MSSALNNKYQLPLPPIFSSAVKSGEDQYNNKNGIISLDDIFDEFLFSSENNKNKFNNNPSSSDNYKDDDDDGDDDNSDDGSDDDEEGADGKKRKRTSRSLNRSMTNEQKVERRYVLLCAVLLLSCIYVFFCWISQHLLAINPYRSYFKL